MWRHETTLDLVKDKPGMVLVASFLQCLRKIISVLGCQAYEDLEWIPASSSAHKFVQMCLMLNHLGRCGWFLWMKRSDEVTKSAEVTNQRLPLTRQGIVRLNTGFRCLQIQLIRSFQPLPTTMVQGLLRLMQRPGSPVNPLAVEMLVGIPMEKTTLELGYLGRLVWNHPWDIPINRPLTWHFSMACDLVVWHCLTILTQA